MPSRLRTVADVAERQLCTGCGVCAYLDPERVRMTDTRDQGRRPVLVGARRDAARDAAVLGACPGLEPSRPGAPSMPAETIEELRASWGPVLEMWEGHATDARLRFRGSSGGAISAISAWALERGGMRGVLHIAARRDVPYLNETVLSTTREQVLERSGSRYAPASPCDGLQRIQDAPGPCVFVGKPCDCAATQRARRLRPALDRNLGLVVGFFCAGTPTTAGTLAMLAKMGVEDPAKVRSLRYRGDGWPGSATAVVETADGRVETRRLTYAQSWGEVLADHKQWRCNLCPDRTGEAADLSFGDPWWAGVPDDAPGRSLIVVRTERGRQALHAAMAAGYIAAEPAEPWKLRASQQGFPVVRGAIWGRLMTLRLLLVPTPRYVGFSLFRHWLRELTAYDKFRSVAGTARRAVTRGLWRRVAIVPLAEPPRRGAANGAVTQSVAPPVAAVPCAPSAAAPALDRTLAGAPTFRDLPPC
jgi:coenzyme F420 hydrogenase subunit beta